jgi:hypothetical protein
LAADRGYLNKVIETKTNILKAGQYVPDSGKFYIDKDLFKEVRIPEHFLLSDAETGQVLTEFKKSSFEIPYKSHKIYIANVCKKLGNSSQQRMLIDKVMIFFPAKVFGDKYFGGITKQGMIEVLEFLRDEGYLIFDDVIKIYKGIYVKDLDIKIDRLLKPTDREQIDEYYKELKDRFNGGSDDWHYFNNKKNGFGISCWDRGKSKLKTPFFKFYDKNAELKNRNNIDFFNSLSQELREEFNKHFVLRFEYTMKDNNFFKKHELSNRLEEILEVPQSKWHDVGLWFLRSAFDKPTRFVDFSKVNLDDRTKMALILWLHELGKSKGAIMSLIVALGKDKKERYRQRIRFEKWWSIATTPNEYTAEALARVERVSKWDRFIGLS